jgi:hypothetical protein
MEKFEFEKQLEAKLLEEIKDKHSLPSQKLYVKQQFSYQMFFIQFLILIFIISLISIITIPIFDYFSFYNSFDLTDAVPLLKDAASVIIEVSDTKKLQ